VIGGQKRWPEVGDHHRVDLEQTTTMVARETQLLSQPAVGAHAGAAEEVAGKVKKVHAKLIWIW